MARVIVATVIVAGCAATPVVELHAAAPVTTTTVKRWMPAPQVAVTTTTEPPPLGGVWERLRQCESGDDYSIDTGNGFYGAYQFDRATFDALHTGYSRADLAPYWVQDAAAVKLQAERGWEPWPVCGPRAAT